jgi:hypothetical protein
MSQASNWLKVLSLDRHWLNTSGARWPAAKKIDCPLEFIQVSKAPALHTKSYYVQLVLVKLFLCLAFCINTVGVDILLY